LGWCLALVFFVQKYGGFFYERGEDEREGGFIADTLASGLAFRFFLAFALFLWHGGLGLEGGVG
jgi:hypothetical protein